MTRSSTLPAAPRGRLPALPSVPPVPLLRDVRVRLVLTSATLLFVELLLIRWIPSNVKYVGFFTNFILMASFLGIGLGILLGRRGRRLPFSPFAPLLFLVVLLVVNAQLNVQVKSANEIFFGLAESNSANTNYIVLPLVFVLVTALMAALALPLGPLLRSRPPLQAYALDITGSLIGIAAFTRLSAFQTQPVVWFSIVAVLLLLLALGVGVSLAAPISGLAMLGVVWLSYTSASGTIWSPYYRINAAFGSNGYFNINVDGIPHQGVAPPSMAKAPWYDQIYRWFPSKHFDNVLVIGAGSGTDVAVALQHGVGHVDAVEIDPAIAQLGRQDNWQKPYQDPRVTVINNDGRAFLRTTDKKYDLVIFALPDSLTLVSSTGNIRLESFLFTEEAFTSVKAHLNDGGAFVLYNFYRDDWLISKIDSMLTSAFDGTRPLLKTLAREQATFATGPLVQALHGGAPPGDTVSAGPSIGPSTFQNATDDWPFLYLRTPTIDAYVPALAFVLAFALLAVGLSGRATGAPLRQFSPHFFVLGSAFMLLETKSLVSFALLFGTTWLVNSLAFFAILASVLIAILLNARLQIRHPAPLYALLFVAIAIAFLLPPESLLIDPPLLRYALASMLAFAPVFLANLIFTYSFRDTRVADMAFASNLLGAVVGGVLEYTALLTGYRVLLLVVAGLYALAWLFATRVRVLADRQLELEPEAASGWPEDEEGAIGPEAPAT